MTDVKITLDADAAGLTAAVGKSTKAVDGLSKAVAGAERAGASGFGGTRAGLQSISTQLSQVRSQVGNLAAGFVGFQLANSLIGSAVAAAKTGMAFDKLNNTLRFASGNAQEFATNNAFLKRTVGELGLDLLSAGSAFASLAAAARGTKLEGDGARSVFDAVAKASTAMGLSAEQTEGSLLAIQQMISKGTVSAEELRGQLGERLPGAFQIAARSMGVTTEALGKMLEQGALSTEVFLPRFAAQMRLEMGGAARDAADSVQANTNRMKTAFTELQVTYNNSEFNNEKLKGVTLFLNGLTSQLAGNKGDFKGWADDVADSLAFMADAAMTTARIVGIAFSTLKVAGQSYVETYERVAAKAGNIRENFNLLDGAKFKAGSAAIDTEFDGRAKAIADGYTKQLDTLLKGADSVRRGVDKVRTDAAASADQDRRQQASDALRQFGKDRKLLATKPVLTPQKKEGKKSSFTDFTDEIGQGVARLLEQSDPAKLTILNAQLEKLKQLEKLGIDPDIISSARDNLTGLTEKRKADREEVERAFEAQQGQLDRMRELATAAEQERDAYGLSTQALERLTRQREDEDIAAKRSLARLFQDIDITGLSAATYREQADALERAAAARRSLQSAQELAATDPYTGAQRGVQTYLETIAKAGKATEDAVGRSLQGIEDGLVELVTTGKFNMRSLVDQMIAEAFRLAVIRPMMQAAFGGGSEGGGINWAGIIGSIGSAWSGSYNANYGNEGLNYAQPRAKGGATRRGSMYEVNEEGPEVLSVRGRDYLMMGAENGRVSANRSAAAASSNRAALTQGAPAPNVMVNVRNEAGQVVQASAQSDGNGGVEVLVREIEGRIGSNVARGRGPVSSGMRARGINTSGALPRIG